MLSDIANAIIIGIVQGLSEFLPISSSLHIILIQDLFGMNFESKLLEVFAQLGSILALMIIKRDLIGNLMISFFKSIISPKNLSDKEKNNTNTALNVIISCIPVVIFGLLFHDFIKTTMHNYTIYSISLGLGGLLLIYAYYKSSFSQEISKLSALKIGLFQVISLIPGVSRSGSTIIGGIFSGLDRKTAIEYSFLISIPTIFAANIYSIYKSLGSINPDEIIILVISLFASFLVSLLVFRTMIKFLIGQGLLFCGIYRLILSFYI